MYHIYRENERVSYQLFVRSYSRTAIFNVRLDCVKVIVVQKICILRSRYHLVSYLELGIDPTGMADLFLHVSHTHVF